LIIFWGYGLDLALMAKVAEKRKKKLWEEMMVKS